MKVKVFVGILVFLCLGAVYFTGWSANSPQSGNDGMWLEFSNEETDSNNISNDEPDKEKEEETTKATICVYVCGNVVTPGVYNLSEDARVYEAVEAAGGVTEDGYTEYMELAGFLRDGQSIYVPTKEEAESGGGNLMSGSNTQETGEFAGLINLNTADKSKLISLPGIGEAKAEAIIKYREEVGGFKSPEEIKNISGIKDAAYYKIKDLICVY